MRLLAIALLLAPSIALADPITPCFVPSTTNCAEVVAAQIDAAKTSVRVQAYGFTSLPIERALVAAHKRGVDVQVILDRSNLHQRYSGLSLMEQADVPTSIDSAHAISHNKVIVIDDQTVITGSFNFTKAAQAHNAENLLVIHDAELAAAYLANWKVHRAHAREAK